MAPFKRDDRFRRKDSGKPKLLLCKPVRDQWAEFAASIFDGVPDVHPTQKEEMKKAFYAGFFACFQTMNEISLASEDTDASEEAAAAQLTALERECIDFATSVARSAPRNP